MKLLLSLAMAAVMSCCAAHAENAAVRRAIDGYVLPAYAGFHAAAERMREGMEHLCAQPGQAVVEQVRFDFTSLAGFWSEAELVRFGPVTEENRLERILFWPDRKSIGLKQVQAALAGKDPTANDPQRLKDKSVAMQGLGALEFVLFGTGSETLAGQADPYRCEYGRAIATNIERMAGEIQAGWLDPKGIAATWANPAADNALYRSDNEAMTELLDVLVHGLELTRDVRINGFLGDTAEDDKPKQAIYWRSQATLTSLSANLSGLRTLLHATDFAALLPADAAWIPQSAEFEFANGARALASLDRTPVADLLADAERRQKLVYVRLVTSSLSDIFGTKLAPALGLSAGFSSLDGD